MSDIVVVGSVNLDLTSHLPRWPHIGETVTARTTQTGLGGKGANQAVAAARLGASVSLIGAVGADGFGREVTQCLSQAKVSLALHHPTEAATGMAFIDVGPDGDNIIRLSEGANAKLSTDVIQKNQVLISQAKVLLLQNEVPLAVSLQAARIARRSHVRVIMDPAPTPDPVWSAKTLSHFDIVTPNTQEAGLLTGTTPRSLSEAEEAAAALCKAGPRGAIVTMGRLGVAWYIGTSRGQAPAPQVTTVDTVAAGDCFNGALAVFLASGQQPEEAIRFAIDAAALATTRHGAAKAAPSLAQLLAFRADHEIAPLATG